MKQRSVHAWLSKGTKSMVGHHDLEDHNMTNKTNKQPSLMDTHH
jgi:hypothetical protein